MLQFGFLESKSYSSLFGLDYNDVSIVVLVYFNDIIITCRSFTHVSSFISSLYFIFDLKDISILNYFIGLEVVIQSDVLWLNQENHISELLHRCDMDSVNKCDTLIVVGKGLSKQDDIALDDASMYRSMVGDLQYCTLTRPDISFSVKK